MSNVTRLEPEHNDTADPRLPPRTRAQCATTEHIAWCMSALVVGCGTTEMFRADAALNPEFSEGCFNNVVIFNATAVYGPVRPSVYGFIQYSSVQWWVRDERRRVKAGVF